ncbi:hypothetical protein AJ80_00313 [Polytolypa hystricis UAMH7299]|uniref:Uncharacterized protein n=1 Tax=Polytolypa hystricis (strain UAMH7299) TaxID=1447883 RepID=A0A2B7Z5D9_POLH7|nr:hypothetical protein AJ80_00313 [Polytolypa hystricis UAMH7299]
MLSQHSNKLDETIIVKGAQNHPRVKNELDILKPPHSRLDRIRRRREAISKLDQKPGLKTQHIQPLIGEIQDPTEPTIIVLKHLDNDLLSTSKKMTLPQKEFKEPFNHIHHHGSSLA